MSRVRRATAIAACILLLVACSSGSDGDEGADEAEPTTTTTTSAPMPLPTSFPAPTGPPCTSGENGATLITPDCVDPEIAGAPFVEVDEQRTTTDPRSKVTVAFRYVNGGFTDSDVRFSYYFPPADDYDGRFFESTYPTIGEEDAEPATIAFAIANGAYVASSNNAGGVSENSTLGGYRANAAAAKFSRVIAAELYGSDAPIRGYIYGGSGGAYQTLAAAENTRDVWQGSVPMVPGVPNSIPSFMSVQVLALRTLADKWPDIVDALEPGGSGDPYATLDDEQKAILEEATRLGHPLRGWWQYETLRGGAFALVAPAVEGVDGSYVDDFFTVPGYEGTDPEVAAARVQFETTIAATSDGGVTLADEPSGYLDFADLVVTSGTAAGKTVPLVELDGTEVTFPDDADPAVTDAIAVGDAVRVDNSFYLALSYYHRHQVPEPDQYGWNQFRGPDGAPQPVQRPVLVGEVLSQVFGGVATGRFNGKMIMLSSLLDVQAFPWAADWYRTKATEALGDQLDDRYRLWYMDNADHQPPSTKAGYAHIVLYEPELQQALLDLDAWVLDDTPPPVSSSYQVTDDDQVELATSADERGGVQPLTTLAVNDGDQCEDADSVVTEVDAGKPVAFDVTAQVPPNTGKIVKVEWDFESTGRFRTTSDLDEPAAEIDLCENHTYDEPGTHFAVVRVTSQREEDAGADFRLIQNLARVRVIVG